MRAIVLILLFLEASTLNVSAQKWDYNWLSGYDSNVIHDTMNHPLFGISRFDFNTDSPVISIDSLGINFNRCISAISDNSGRLLFYTNGVRVNNYLDELVQNGDSLGWGGLYNSFSPYEYNDGNANQDILFTLPNPRQANVFDIFYVFIDTINGGTSIANKKILRSRIDMNANGGYGALVEKDRVIYQQQEVSGSIIAVKHANGRDWWICSGLIGTNCYSVMLYDGGDSVTATMQCGGAFLVPGDLNSARFSPDGSLYMEVSSDGAGSVFRFDRCSGVLSVLEKFDPNSVSDSVNNYPGGLEFSSDSRFAYVFCGPKIIQLDLQASPIINSAQVIAVIDTTQVSFGYGQLAPDGKIYVCTEGSNYYISTIQNPNGQGANCNFLAHNIRTLSWIIGLPYYPNYRLGKLIGSACDTVLNVNELSNLGEIKLFPNPTNAIITFDYGFINWGQGQLILEVCDIWGQIVYSQKLPMYSGFQNVDASSFSDGLYQVFITCNNAVVATQKFVKQ